MKTASPLRYPGGKWRIVQFIQKLIEINKFAGRDYVEPFAGGASLALSLLFKDVVSCIHLNDLDPAIHSFWWSVLRHPEELARLVRDAPLNVAEWVRQRAIYSRGSREGRLALGFATFYLNRTSHSGIMNGGVIGGRAQDGPWQIDARFNKPDLQRRILRIASAGDRIRIYGQDAVAFLSKQALGKRSIVYLDPPYFRPGKALYLNAYEPSDHARLKALVKKLPYPWLVSYDDTPEIRRLYRGLPSRQISLLHTARSSHIGREVMFFGPGIKIPRGVLPDAGG